MNNVAVILARGGSKGIPNKNIVTLNNRPLIYYTLKAALLSKVNSVWVSTDSEDIAKIAEDYGAKIIWRSSEFATDYSTSEQALLHFCEQVPGDNLIFIQPTSPLLQSKDIDDGLLLMKNYDSIFSGYLEHWIPRWELHSESVIERQWDKEHRPRRQDCNSLIVENGAVYISSYEAIKKSKLRYSGKIGFLEMPMSRSFQVDTYEDLFIIESLLKNQS